MSQRTCSEDGCDEKHFGRGMCSRHYNRWAYRRRRDPERWAAFRSELEAAQAADTSALLHQEKTCTKCRERKPKDEFTTAPRSRDGLHSWCKACLRNLANRNYDPERARQKHAEKKADPAYRAMKKSAYDRWRGQHPERAKAAYKRWRKAHPERVAATDRAWREANPERVRHHRRQHGALRRARRRNATTGRVSYAAILERDGMVCHLCRLEIAGPDDLHFDHVVPLARGGEHSMANIRPAHAACNLRKKDKLLSELDWLPVN